MKNESFVAYIATTNNENYRVAFGHFENLEETQFVEFEYTYYGVFIHYYCNNCKECQAKTKDKFLEYKSNSEERYNEFNSNNKLKDLLMEYTKQGCDYQHTQDCNCDACNLLPNNLYIFSVDVIKVVKNLFELNNNH